MSKVNLPPIPGGYLSLGAINTRFAAIEDAFENTLSLDGSLPNSMEADLDMDSNDILNVGLISVDDINIQGLTTGGILTEASEAAVAAGISAQEAEQSALDASANAEARQVDSVSELSTSTFPANIQRLWLMGYYGAGTAGGGPLYRDSDDTTTEDNGGTVFVDEDGVRWKRITAQTPEDWGAVGDGVADDTDAIAAWWEHGTEEKLVARGNYAVFGEDQFSADVGDESFVVDGEGANFEVNELRAYLFRLNAIGDAQIDISGFTIVGNDNVARCVEVRSTGATARYVRIKNIVCLGTFANNALTYSGSSIAITISAETLFAEVSDCLINGVNRNYVNPGIVASVGISVTNITRTAIVKGNRILSVGSPEDDVDADGISLFSRDRLIDPTVKQTVTVRAYNNTLRDCKGRFFKLQTTEAYVLHNKFETSVQAIANGHRAVDCQFGGCRVESNYWNLNNVALDGGIINEIEFVRVHLRGTGDYENRSVVADNYINLEKKIRYLLFVQMDAGVAHVECRDNFVKSKGANGYIREQFARLNGGVADYDSVTLDIQRNHYPADRDSIVVLDSSFGTTAAAADKAEFVLIGNVNSRSPTPANILLTVAGGGTPHLNNIRIHSNETGGENRINAQSLTPEGIKPDSGFYFGTDGSTGGIVGAPSGYNRFVHVATSGRYASLSKTGSFVYRITEDTAWTEVTGTTL